MNLCHDFHVGRNSGPSCCLKGWTTDFPRSKVWRYTLAVTAWLSVDRWRDVQAEEGWRLWGMLRSGLGRGKRMGWDERDGWRENCEIMASVLDWFICIVKAQIHYCFCGHNWGWKSCFTPSSISPFFFSPHMDVISSNLSGFVKWQPDREPEEFCCVARTWHTTFALVKHCPLSPFCPAYYYSSNSECPSSSKNLKSWTQDCGNLRIDVGSTNTLSNFSKVPLRSECEARLRWRKGRLEREGPILIVWGKERVNVPKINHRNYCHPWETC